MYFLTTQAALLDKQMKLALSLDELHTAENARAEQVMGRWQVRQLAAIGLGAAEHVAPMLLASNAQARFIFA